MSLLSLPNELLTIIIRQLDTQSVCNLYESCRHLRDIICMPGVVRECQFSVSKLATVKSLELDFFNDIAGHLKALNLSGVSDLDKTVQIPALGKLQSLCDLDVSYTQITLPDYLEITKITKTLKSLAINFSFDRNYVYVDKKLLLVYQQAFEGLKNIHFVGNSRDLLDRKLLICMLQKAELFTLKFTLCKNNFISYAICNNDDCNNMRMVKMSHCEFFFLEEFYLNDIPLYTLLFFKQMDLKEYEIVLFQLSIDSEMYSTPFLVEFIKKHFDVEVNDLSDLKFLMGLGQATVMFWDKKRTKFYDTFYSKLLYILKENLIYNFDAQTFEPVPSNFKRYCVEQDCPSPDSSYEFDCDYNFEGKRRKLSYRSYRINYDAAFKEKINIQLRILFLDNFKPVTLRSCDFLKKLTHLTLDGDIRYTATFFKKLFESSQCLVTLQIMKKKGIVSSPLTYLKLTKLKNIFLYVKGSHIFPIYNCLSQCKTLENIHLVNTCHSSIYTNTVDDLPNPTELFSRCTGLYNFSFQSHDIYGAHRDQMIQYYKNVRAQLGLDGLNIAMFPYRDQVEYQYNPYFKVFDVFQLKPM